MTHHAATNRSAIDHSDKALLPSRRLAYVELQVSSLQDGFAWTFDEEAGEDVYWELGYVLGRSTGGHGPTYGTDVRWISVCLPGNPGLILTCPPLYLG